MKNITAYCWGGGLIEFDHSAKNPPRSLMIFRGPEKRVLKAIRQLARHSLDGSLLVPGVPESRTPLKAVDAVVKFVEIVRKHIEHTETRTP